MKTSTLINCTNYFNDVGCKRLSEALESGETVRIYIDCIGHTRDHYETVNYVEWLNEKYGERLIVRTDAHGDKVYSLED